jgi:hypothetical protein
MPAPLFRWARELSGRSAPRYTAGPATSAALRATGARAASSGDVVHLPGPPAATGPAGAVLAHELAHLRQPLGRPRFLLERATSTPDADERATVQRLARPGAPLTTAGTGAGIARATGAGIIEDLPVAPGGTGGLLEAARAAAREELATLTGGGDRTGPAAGLEGPLATTSEPMATWTAGAFTDPGSALSPGSAPFPVGPAPTGNGTGPTTGLEPTVRTAFSAGASTLFGPGTASGAGASGEPGAPILPEQIVDSMVDALEQRVLAELERRGGRYSGAF